LVAGFGGDGIRGGKGGSILGNKSATPDAVTADFTATAGAGGEGTKRGGNGGQIKNISPVLRFPPNVISSGFESGSLIYTAGDGGSAVSGRGGDGGSILNSTPRPNARIDTAVLLTAGDAGSGTSGGNGGSVIGINPTLSGPTPRTLQVIAGHGGDASSGNGGIGGSVEAINVSSRGSGPAANRILAGDGGDSAGRRGGAGGQIFDIRSDSPEGSFAVVAGAGGTGLTVGGKGGSVVKAQISLGSSTQAKGLIIAGAGGDATAFTPNSNDPAANQGQNAFGGRVGRGGNGGSIIDFQQQGNTGAHFDLIAGNGGSTLNFGTVTDTTLFVGKGGSVRNVTLAGNVGSIIPGVGIKSYNNLDAGETVADFVENRLRGGFGQLTDADGNVGIVVGAAGRNKAVAVDPNQPLEFVDQPASGSRNGSLINISVNNLMSAVAGSVDRIASIQVSRDIRVPGGVIGADKAVIGQRDYLDRDGNPTSEPLLDGRLVDGALVTNRLLTATGQNTNLPSERVFIK
jgi:hypothetical protein